jgi:hypothetical protein
MINVLVSTNRTQGAAPGDFCWVPEGELVARYGVVCASERPDGSGCGCGRAFAGFSTHQATTTAMVVQIDMTEEEWRAALHQTLVDTGWAELMTADEVAELIDELVEIDLRSAAQLAPGTILGRLAYNEPDGSTQDTLLDRSALRSP